MNSRVTVAKYLEDLAIRGQYYFVLADLIRDLGIKKSSASNSLSRLAKANKVRMIRKGFGIYTGHTSGVLDPSYFLNAMMNFISAKYYVGLLNAAAFRGASHQAVMSYTVVVDKVTKPVNLDKLLIDFITKKNFDDISEIEKVAGIGGYYNISSPELTMIDLVRFPHKSGGLNNVATVINELIEKVSPQKLKVIITKKITPTTTLQRLGYLLDVILNEKKLSREIEKELKERRIQKIPLSFSKEINDSRHNEKWGLYLNADVEPDE